MRERKKNNPMDNWLVRFDDGGTSYNNFQWRPIGEWTVAPDWDPAPVCPGGLHGQGPGGWGHCEPGRTFNLCEYDPDAGVVVVDGNKLKVRRARRIAIDTEAWERVTELTHNAFPGSLDLRRYLHRLPERLTTVGGYLYLGAYRYRLPKRLATVGDFLYLGDYPYRLPEGLTTVGGSLDLHDYPHQLPERLTTVGGYLNLRDYPHRLPKRLTTVGGYLNLRDYPHRLPAGLKRN